MPHRMTEDVFKQVYCAGAIKEVHIDLFEGDAYIGYTTGDGIQGVIHSKRGEAKTYRIETALRFLQVQGVRSVPVHLVPDVPHPLDR